MKSNPEKVMLFGATSAIATATAQRLARTGATFHLVARDAEKLTRLERELIERGAKQVTWQCADFLDFAGHPGLVDRAFREIGNPDIVLVAYGIFSNDEALTDFATLEKLTRLNFLSVASLLEPVTARLIAAKTKCRLAVISSIAGDRGKARNFAYGVSKAALTAYLQGLRNCLHPHGIDVLTIKPGLVRSPMTRHLRHSPLFTQPDTVARGIVHALSRSQPETYLPWFWKPIMVAVRNLPEFIFKRVRL